MARLLNFQNNHDKSSHGWLSTSPLTVLTPSKPCLILACIVRIKIDVQTRYWAISKLEHVTETRRQGFRRLPTTYQTFCVPCATESIRGTLKQNVRYEAG